MKILLKNGNIIDGTAKAMFVGDVLIEDNIIKTIASDIKEEVDRMIDCTGLCVAPGFIDAHSHNDFFYDKDMPEKFFAPFIEQGITTQITGNCGFSPFGIAEDSPYKDKVGGGLFHTKSAGSFDDFINSTKDNLLVNIVPLIGHGTTRISMSGYNVEPLNEEQIKKQCELTREAMKKGAFGGSLGFMYEPGIYSKKDEIYAFAKVIAEYGGILTVHPRACSKVALGYPLLSKPHIEIALDEVIDIMKATRVKTEYSHLIFVGKSSWSSCDTMLNKFKTLREEGYDIAYDNYSFTYGASVITVVLPPWYMALPKEKRSSRINRFKLKLMTFITKKALGIDFCDLHIAYISDKDKQYEGKTVSECAKKEGLSDFDMYIKLVELSNGQGRLYLDKYYNDEIIKKLMLDDNSVFMTDAWVEEAGTQNGAAYQGFVNFLCLAKKYNIGLEQVINKMTGKTASRFGIPQRGILKEEYFADVTIFDPAKLSVNINEAETKPTGIQYVIINGKVVVDNTIYSPSKVGQLILKV